MKLRNAAALAWLIFLQSYLLTVSGGAGTARAAEAKTSSFVVKDIAKVLMGSGPVTIEVLSNDSDPAWNRLHITSVTTPRFGVAQISPDGRSVIYLPGTKFRTSDAFFYTASDSFGNTGTAKVIVRNPIAAYRGTYWGYILDSVNGPAIGTVSLPLHESGAFTCRFAFAGHSFRVSDAFDVDRSTSFGFVVGGTEFKVQLGLDVTADGVFEVSGSLDNGERQLPVVAQQGLLQALPGMAGQYCMSISNPEHSGYAVLNVVPTGIATLAGKLDGLPFSAEGTARADGRVYFYHPRLGALSIPLNGDAIDEAAHSWSGPVSFFGPPPGIGEGAFSLTGARYIPPAQGSLVLGSPGPKLNRYQAVFEGGGLSKRFETDAILYPDQCFVARMPAGQWLQLSVCPGNGTFEGYFSLPGLASGMRIDGAVLQTSGKAIGSFLGPRGVGSVIIVPNYESGNP